MPRPLNIKNHLLESRVFSMRVFVASIFICILTSILIARIYQLQVFEYEIHTTQSEKNRIKLEPIPPTRGLIYDASGSLVAKNLPSHTVSLVKEKIENLDESLALIQSLIDIKPANLERFKSHFTRPRRPYEPVPLKLNLTEPEIARLSVNQHKMPGMEISAELIRYYPYADKLAHTVGYVGRINERDEARIDQAQYARTHYIGKIGLESFYEKMLLGQVGHQKVEVNARGRVLKVLERTDPVPGRDLTLFLDMPTQEAAIRALASRKGAVVAIEPASGGVVAFVSQPSFDTNLFVRGIDQKTYSGLNTNPARPLFNRAIQGQYPPGSTIKPLVALAGLESGAMTWDQEIDDPGFFQLENESHRYRDWKRWGHGKVDMMKAIVESCDTYFYEMSDIMGIDTMHRILGPFALGNKTGIDLPSEQTGLLPSSKWKVNRYGQPWYPGETLIAGIGQGFMLTTPLQLAVSTAILANRGHIIQPKMVKTIGPAQGIQPFSENPTPKSPPSEKPIINENISNNKTTRDGVNGKKVKNEEQEETQKQTQKAKQPTSQQIKLSKVEYWQKIIDAMEAVVHSPKGTAKGISENLSYHIAGKTGTAQVIKIEQNATYDAEKIAEEHRDHALFVAFAPVEDPLIAIAVIVENGGGGGSTAAPVAREVLDAYLLPRLGITINPPEPITDSTPGSTPDSTQSSNITESNP